ncbi:DUF2474 domain-containing protein [Pigmentiphaga sp. NML080357]|nr:DUF2474 family protein [Pigmentiphaga sp. NML080357]OVZ56921.1 DUF2474 domain-containing protein [Pigmentiphaga sp. NML080357]
MAGARRAWARRLAWLVALWAAGVAAVFVVAALLKLLMRGVGLA